MKRFLFLLAAIMAGTLLSVAEPLNIDRFFGPEYASNPKVQMVDMNGGGPDKVKIYRSLSVSGDRDLADRIAAAVAKDGSRARAKEVSYKEGTLYYGFYSMGGPQRQRRYILYLNRRPAGKEKTTLIYIEGDLGEAEIKKLINK